MSGLNVHIKDEATLTWLMLRWALWVDKKLCALGVAISPECVRCANAVEFIEHASFHCSVVPCCVSSLGRTSPDVAAIPHCWLWADSCKDKKWQVELDIFFYSGTSSQSSFSSSLAMDRRRVPPELLESSQYTTKVKIYVVYKIILQDLIKNRGR